MKDCAWCGKQLVPKDGERPFAFRARKCCDYSCAHKNRARTVATETDLTGHRFGEWTVLSRLDNTHWLARCSCGHENQLKTSTLTLGRSMRCRDHEIRRVLGPVDLPRATGQRRSAGDRLPGGALECILARVMPEPNTGCWLWLGNLDSGGYGTIRVNYNRVLAHRASYELAFGPLGPGMCACHKCDTPACVNPDHLFAGTLADNVHDMVRKGRHRPRGSSKLCAVERLVGK